MKKILVIIFCLVNLTATFSQTVPTAQPLPYTQDFAALVATSTSYPAGWQGWQLNSTTGSSSAFRTTAAIANLALLASSTAATNTGGVHNYNGKIGILGSGSNDPSLCLAVSTTGKVNIAVTFDISTIRNPYNGGAETRRNNVELQYCVGAALGTFTSVTGSIYRNNTTTQTGAVTTQQNAARYQYILPAACENQTVVQLRWVQRDSVGAGNRPSFAIDNVIVCPAPIVTATVTPTCSAVRSGAVTLNISAGMPPYTVAWDTVNKSGPQFAVTAVTKNNTHPYFGVGFGAGYALDGIQGKELTVTRGVNYTFSGTFPGHPFHITTSSVGASFAGEVSSGTTNNETQGGALVFTPNNSHPSLLWYMCGVHQNMGWKININNGYIPGGNSISGLGAGTYTAAVSSSDGCITTITVVIATVASPSVTATNNGPKCEGSNIQLSSTGGVSYSWAGPLSFTSFSQNPVLSNVVSANAGLYTVTGTAANGCTDTGLTVVTIMAGPHIYTFDPSFGPPLTTVTLDGTGFTNSTQAQLGGQTNAVTIVNDTTLQFDVVAGSSSGNIIVTNSNGCRDTSDSVFVVINTSSLNLKVYFEGYYDPDNDRQNSSLSDTTKADTLQVLLYTENDLLVPAYSVTSRIGTNGLGTFVFPWQVINNEYYVVVKQRNTIETW
ncbi:MAG: hypothetical protein ABI772_14220, partial [Bacteroidota bacterium]